MGKVLQGWSDGEVGKALTCDGELLLRICAGLARGREGWELGQLQLRLAWAGGKVIKICTDHCQGSRQVRATEDIQRCDKKLLRSQSIAE